MLTDCTAIKKKELYISGYLCMLVCIFPRDTMLVTKIKSQNDTYVGCHVRKHTVGSDALRSLRGRGVHTDTLAVGTLLQGGARGSTGLGQRELYYEKNVLAQKG